MHDNLFIVCVQQFATMQCGIGWRVRCKVYRSQRPIGEDFGKSQIEILK